MWISIILCRLWWLKEKINQTIIILVGLSVEGWHSGERVHFSPRRLEFKSRLLSFGVTWVHGWVVCWFFSVLWGFFPTFFGFPPLAKSISKFHLEISGIREPLCWIHCNFQFFLFFSFLLISCVILKTVFSFIWKEMNLNANYTVITCM